LFWTDNNNHNHKCAKRDAWDAMTTDRSYRPALSLEEALKELCKNAGTQFDSKIITHLKHSSFQALTQKEV